MASEALQNNAEFYSKHHGLIYHWETDVNLESPSSWKKPILAEDRFVHDYYNSLQFTLYETGHPETIDRTDEPRKKPTKEQVTVVVLSAPFECSGIVLEGGKLLPDGFHLVFSPSWLSKTPSEEYEGLYTLWLHKSISFHANGQTYLDEYRPPRKVTYFVNFFTENVTSGQRNDGIEIERGLECPMSSSVSLCHMVDDKVWTRDIMASVGMGVPETVAFRRKNMRELNSVQDKIRLIDFDDYASLDKNTVVNEITQFCNRMQNKGVAKIVVKPSGPQYLGSAGVSFHGVTDVQAILKAASVLLSEINEGSSVLVEQFMEPMVPVIPKGDLNRGVALKLIFQTLGAEPPPPWLVDERFGFRCRSTVCRDHDNNPVTTLINCSIGNKKAPINGDYSMFQTLHTTMAAYGVTDPDEIRGLELDVRSQSAAVLKKIMEREKEMPAEERGELRAQTDVIGIDMIVTRKQGKLVPVGIEVNSHDCTVNGMCFDYMVNFGRLLLPEPYDRSVHVAANPPMCDCVHSKCNLNPSICGDFPNSCQCAAKDLMSNNNTVLCDPSESSKTTHICSSNSCDVSKNKVEAVTQNIKNMVVESEKSIDTTVVPKELQNCIDHSRDIQERNVRMQESRYYSGDVMGMSVRPWVRTMIMRSQRYLIVGKKMLVVGAGDVSKKKIWHDMTAYGVEVYMVDSDPDHPFKDSVHQFLHYDYSNHKNDTTHASNIVSLLQSSGIKVDGCLTFWEDCIPLTALLNQKLGTKGLKYEAALNAKVKSRTQNELIGRKGDIPHWPRTLLYVGKAHHISSDADIPFVAESIGFPAILKLEHGSSAIGVTLVHNQEEMMDSYEKITSTLQKDSDFSGIGLGFDNSMMAMEYFAGTEHDVELVLYQGKIVAAFVSDNGPTNYPSFTETVSVMPSCLPLDKRAQLIIASYQCCVENGLGEGVFNVEMKMTETGPKLIEINARMGGNCLRDWVIRLYGVDLVLTCIVIAANIKPFVPKCFTNEQLMGIMVVPSIHKHLHEDEAYKHRLGDMEETGEITWTDLGHIEKFMPGQFEEPMGNITVSGRNIEGAKRKLLSVCKQLKIDFEKYPVSQFIQYF